jgi:hypothetical protein
MVDSCEHGNEPLSFMKDKEFLYQLNDIFSVSNLLHGVSESVS